MTRYAERDTGAKPHSNPTCDISVVIPTFNRREDLTRLLESLWHQTLDKPRFEVIVASDRSTDGTVEMVQKFADRAWSLKLLQLANRGPAAARNAGAKEARAPYIAFTDDDCITTPDWLEKILRTFGERGVIGIQGRTTTDRELRTPLTHEIEVLRPWTSTVPTCNAAFTRRAFECVGGFDERFPFAHNEDADLAWRIEDLGRIIYAPDVHIRHPPRRDSFLKRARTVRVFQSDFLLYYKNPVKYRRYISRSPWLTIYWTVFVGHQATLAKACGAHLVRSGSVLLFAQGVALLFARWMGLLWYLPAYRRTQVVWRDKFAATGSPAT